MTTLGRLGKDQFILDRTAAALGDVELLRRFIGPNANYYVDIWKVNRSRNAGRFVMRPSWNWAAAMFFWPWALYRKMWLWAFLGFLLFHIPGLSGNEYLVLSIPMSVVTGLFGNGLYLRHALARIAKIKTTSTSKDELLERVEKAGGVSKAAVWLSFGMVIALVALLRLFVALNADFHFVDLPKTSESRSQIVAPIAVDEAAQVWGEIKDTSNPAVLESFIRRYNSPVYANLARARLNELKNGAAATTSNDAATSVPPSSVPNTSEPNNALPSRVVLYDEDPNDPRGQQYTGSVVWRTAPFRASAGQPDDIAVSADVEIPERKLRMTLVLRRNYDPALPASHLVELTFRVPSDFAGLGIDKVPGLLMKSDQLARGTPLRGLSVKVTDKFFLMGLSNRPEDRAFNLALLHGNAWIDIPVVYSNQRRAIVAIEKGASGIAIFEAALAAWGQNP
jgi:hypothetical protein